MCACARPIGSISGDPRFGERTAETLDNHAGAVFFGGPMSANDSDDYIRRRSTGSAAPCASSGRSSASASRAELAMHSRQGRAASAGVTQIGYYPSVPPPPAHRVPDWPEQVYHWHREGFELPPAPNCLAGGDFRTRPFSSAYAFGFQFHPDVTTR